MYTASSFHCADCVARADTSLSLDIVWRPVVAADGVVRDRGAPRRAATASARASDAVGDHGGRRPREDRLGRQRGRPPEHTSRSPPVQGSAQRRLRLLQHESPSGTSAPRRRRRRPSLGWRATGQAACCRRRRRRQRRCPARRWSRRARAPSRRRRRRRGRAEHGRACSMWPPCRRRSPPAPGGRASALRRRRLAVVGTAASASAAAAAAPADESRVRGSLSSCSTIIQRPSRKVWWAGRNACSRTTAGGRSAGLPRRARARAAPPCQT